MWKRHSQAWIPVPWGPPYTYRGTSGGREEVASPSLTKSSKEAATEMWASSRWKGDSVALT